MLNTMYRRFTFRSKKDWVPKINRHSKFNNDSEYLLATKKEDKTPEFLRKAFSTVHNKLLESTVEQKYDRFLRARGFLYRFDQFLLAIADLKKHTEIVSFNIIDYLKKNWVSLSLKEFRILISNGVEFGSFSEDSQFEFLLDLVAIRLSRYDYNKSAPFKSEEESDEMKEIMSVVISQSNKRLKEDKKISQRVNDLSEKLKKIMLITK